ncbi:hypothetical protein [Desulfotruncus alcoholivorax]|uniref:hypothetical protein n=1 Tax=Desulfotruncus alcoholivorax TaxID=265477 RepID=UPI000488B952|nr:hypothetical protein [Desulfotruncus alcoholivorax]
MAAVEIIYVLSFLMEIYGYNIPNKPFVTSGEGKITMNTILELCKPRDTVFDQTRRDVALNLTDLSTNRINAHDFFAENLKENYFSKKYRIWWRN